MRIVHTPLVCLACRHEWMEEMLEDVLIRLWVAHVRLIRCPKCHVNSKQIAFRTGVNSTPDQESV